MKIDVRDAARAIGARVLSPERLPERAEVATDTRALAPGALFVALVGERFDGHGFVAEAIARGASALVVSDASRVPEGVAALVVADTTVAYLGLGAVARRASAARVAAITGSAGKTTTKALLAQILESVAPGRVAATIANENNEIGVAKSLLHLEPDTRYAAIEFGARNFGEIVPLARAAAPDVAVLTNVGDAHLEIMGSPERLLETKWGVFATGASRVLPRGDERLAARARAEGAPVTWFDARAEVSGEISPESWDAGHRAVTLVGRESLVVRDRDGDARSFPIDVTLPGEHNLRNVAAAAAAAYALDVAPERIAAALAHLELPQGRYERISLGTYAAIFDAYNASMSGTLATLASFAREPAARRIAVLGSMAELGPTADEMHERVGAAAARSALDALLVGGDYGGALRRGAREAGFPDERIVPFRSNEIALAWLQANLRADDLVLFKASRKYRLETILSGLGDPRVG